METIIMETGNYYYGNWKLETGNWQLVCFAAILWSGAGGIKIKIV